MAKKSTPKAKTSTSVTAAPSPITMVSVSAEDFVDIVETSMSTTPEPETPVIVDMVSGSVTEPVEIPYSNLPQITTAPQTTAEKFKIIFGKGFFVFKNRTENKGNGVVENLITWAHIVQPRSADEVHIRFIKTSEGDGFLTIDECLNDCLRYAKLL